MGVKRNSSVLLVCLLVYVLVTVVNSQDVETDETEAHKCLDVQDCLVDPEATFAYYRNETYCCKGAHALILSVSGFGFKYTRALYSRTHDNGGRVKRTANPAFKAALQNIKYRCMCKPVGDSGLNVGVYGLSVSSMTDADHDANEVVDKALKKIFGEDDLTVN